MKIAYNSANLCAGGLEQPIGFDAETERTIQIVKPIDAESTEPIPRGNKTTVISFSVVKEHASYDAAEIYAATHENGLAQQATLTVDPETGDGSTYLKATLQKCKVRYLGITTTASYTFICGPAS